MKQKTKAEMIDKILEYYVVGWENDDSKDVYEELQEVYLHGIKGLENESLEYIESEYKKAMTFHLGVVWEEKK